MCGVCSVCVGYVVWCLCVCGVCLCDRVCSVYDVCVWYVWCRGVVCGVVCVYVCVIVCVACVMCVHDVCGLCMICVMCVECVVCVWGGACAEGRDAVLDTGVLPCPSGESARS